MRMTRMSEDEDGDDNADDDAGDDGDDDGVYNRDDIWVRIPIQKRFVRLDLFLSMG